jgi:peptide/nickel transport system substrate-binding protein
VARWDANYDFPRAQSGEIVKSVIPHQRPSGMTGFVMNTRQPVFQDWRVREALITAFNFEFINDTFTGGQQPRIESYFSNSPLGMVPGEPASGRVLEFLAPFAADLPPGTIEGYALPVGDGTERNRAGTERALSLLAEAGWTLDDAGVMRNAAGEALTFEIMLETGSSEPEKMIQIYAEALTKLGIAPTVVQVDGAQFNERITNYDFGMIYYRWALSPSPGNEQTIYWGSSGVAAPGSRNMMGVNSPAIDAMIRQLLTSEDQQDFRAAAEAIDRILTAGRYVIPIYQWSVARIAHDANLHFPEKIPLFGDFPGWQPDVWWCEEDC